MRGEITYSEIIVVARGQQNKDEPHTIRKDNGPYVSIFRNVSVKKICTLNAG